MGILDTHVVLREKFRAPPKGYEYDEESLRTDPLPIKEMTSTPRYESFIVDASEDMVRRDIWHAAE